MYKQKEEIMYVEGVGGNGKEEWIESVEKERMTIKGKSKK